MNSPSFERINYAFRPAKHAQRKMLCEALHSLARIAPLSSYRYVGFGSVGFHDFSLFHQRLGISDMISIEASQHAKKRMSFNRPYSCIRMKWGWSYDVLPLLPWDKRAVVWLDYEHSLDRSKLADISLTTSALRSGSILLVTVPVEPSSLEHSQGGPRHRLEELIERVGEERVPRAVQATDLSNWGTARVTRDIIHNDIVRTLVDRNDALESSKRLLYDQLFNFQYADSKKMLTVGGLIANAGDSSPVNQSLMGLEFVKRAKAPYMIETPILTIRELRLLDSLLPIESGRAQPSWIPAKERRRYSKLYRHFPNYSVVET